MAGDASSMFQDSDLVNWALKMSIERPALLSPALPIGTWTIQSTWKSGQILGGSQNLMSGRAVTPILR